MNSDRIFCCAMALAIAALAEEAQAGPPSSPPQVAAQPVFLLSERELGAGIKVCFLSNGLQMRLPSEKICPYPLKAPPLATGPQPAPASSEVAETGKPVALESTKFIEQPKVPSSTPPKPLAAAPIPVERLPEPIPTKPSAQQQISKPVVLPVAPAQTSNVDSKSQPSAEVNSVDSREVIEDEIADKAIRRCERIGFKVGTEPFKLCAIDQIKILSGYRP